MRLTVLFLTFIVSVAFVGSVFAVAPTKSVEFPGGKDGKVVFEGKTHAGAGLKCNECHTKIFKMKKRGAEGSAKMTMADMTAGKFCGACHDGEKVFKGKKVFKADDKANCVKCHKK